MASRHPFSTLLERKFLEWQLDVGRKSQREFADYLGVNRASLTMWLNGDHLPERANIDKLALKLGPEIYDSFDLPRPNPYLQKINQLFDNLSPEHQQRLAEDAERYSANNHHTKRSPAKRETRTD
jgi:transcriptional regulator with XRE-family HTH domain